MDAKLPAATWSMFTPRNNPGQAPVVPGQTVTDAMLSPGRTFRRGWEQGGNHQRS